MDASKDARIRANKNDAMCETALDQGAKCTGALLACVSLVQGSAQVPRAS